MTRHQFGPRNGNWGLAPKISTMTSLTRQKTDSAFGTKPRLAARRPGGSDASWLAGEPLSMDGRTLLSDDRRQIAIVGDHSPAFGQPEHYEIILYKHRQRLLGRCPRLAMLEACNQIEARDCSNEENGMSRSTTDKMDPRPEMALDQETESLLTAIEQEKIPDRLSKLALELQHALTERRAQGIRH
jgi:hypothetical protein